MRTASGSVVIALLLCTCGATVQAAEWKIDPTVAFRAGYNDNIRMSIDDEISSAEAQLSPSALFSVETPTTGLSGDLRFDFRRFEDDSNLDDNNTRLNLRSFHHLERTRLGMDFNFIKDTTLDSQLEETGLAFDRVRRQRYDASPNWSYEIDERTRVRARYGYSDVQYKNAGQTGFTDFTLNTAEASLTRILNEKTIASSSISRTSSDNDNDVESTNTGLQGGLSYQINETFSTVFSAGIRRSEVDFSQTSQIPIFSGNTIIGFEPLTQDQSNSDWGTTFNISATKTFLRGETNLSASRDISNDINGQPIEVSRLHFSNRYQISEILSANLDLEFYNSQTTNTAGQNLNRDYYQVEPNFTWNLRNYWRLSGSYRYRKQTFDSTSDDATQNTAYLTLTYLWPRIAVSR